MDDVDAQTEKEQAQTATQEKGTEEANEKGRSITEAQEKLEQEETKVRTRDITIESKNQEIERLKKSKEQQDSLVKEIRDES